MVTVCAPISAMSDSSTCSRSGSVDARDARATARCQRCDHPPGPVGAGGHGPAQEAARRCRSGPRAGGAVRARGDPEPRSRSAIAEHAASLVPDGSVVLLDIGTTTSLVARFLRGRTVTVITSSLAVYDELRDDPVVDLMLLGGLVRTNYHSMVGFLTEQAIAQVQADLLFLGTSGVRTRRSASTTAVEVPAKKAMLQVADRVVLLADHDQAPRRRATRVSAGPTGTTCSSPTGSSTTRRRPRWPSARSRSTSRDH